MTITVRFAETDNDVIAIHGFLCVTMGPLLPGEVDPQASASEVWRVVNHECALMAMRDDGFLVGSIGLVKAPYWWNPQLHLLANRWFSVIPDQNIGKILLEHAEDFARNLKDELHPCGLELHIYDEQKGRLVILNRHPLRRSVNPIWTRQPEPAPQPSTTH